MTRHELTVPELGIDDQPIRLSLWLARRGRRVVQGEPIVELLAGAATVDLSAPADGVLRETFVAGDQPVRVGQRLAIVESA